MTCEQIEWCQTLHGNCIQCKFSEVCKLSTESVPIKLKFRSLSSVTKLVEALVIEGYEVTVIPVYTEYSISNIKHYDITMQDKKKND